MQTFRILRVLPFVMIKSYHTISIKRPIALVWGVNFRNFPGYGTKSFDPNIPPNKSIGRGRKWVTPFREKEIWFGLAVSKLYEDKFFLILAV